MKAQQPTIILRHRRENLKKCSLRGLEAREDMLFYTYPKATLPCFDDYILLGMGGKVLSKDDRDSPLFLIDGTWRYAQVMTNQIPGKSRHEVRSLPDIFVTAYPRRQQDCPDPSKGLASIEALYVAYFITGRNTEGLLDNYHWKELFLEKNQEALKGFLSGE